MVYNLLAGSDMLENDRKDCSYFALDSSMIFTVVSTDTFSAKSISLSACNRSLIRIPCANQTPDLLHCVLMADEISIRPAYDYDRVNDKVLKAGKHIQVVVV